MCTGTSALSVSPPGASKKLIKTQLRSTHYGRPKSRKSPIIEIRTSHHTHNYNYHARARGARVRANKQNPIFCYFFFCSHQNFSKTTTITPLVHGTWDTLGHEPGVPPPARPLPGQSHLLHPSTIEMRVRSGDRSSNVEGLLMMISKPAPLPRPDACLFNFVRAGCRKRVKWQLNYECRIVCR